MGVCAGLWSVYTFKMERVIVSHATLCNLHETAAAKTRRDAMWKWRDYLLMLLDWPVAVCVWRCVVSGTCPITAETLLPLCCNLLLQRDCVFGDTRDRLWRVWMSRLGATDVTVSPCIKCTYVKMLACQCKVAWFIYSVAYLTLVSANRPVMITGIFEEINYDQAIFQPCIALGKKRSVFSFDMFTFSRLVDHDSMMLTNWIYLICTCFIWTPGDNLGQSDPIITNTLTVGCFCHCLFSAVSCDFLNLVTSYMQRNQGKVMKNLKLCKITCFSHRNWDWTSIMLIWLGFL